MKQENKQWEWIVSPLLQWYEENERELPWRINSEPYRIWISEIMLQQTRVEAVIPYYLRFMERFPTIQQLAEADEADVLKQWEGLGYYSRARNIKKAAKVICEKYQGVFPGQYEEILALPGIGKYTAGAICSIALGMPKAAVDGNVLRVITRLGAIERDIMDESFRKEIAGQLETVYPKHRCSQFTQSLMELGAMVCVPTGAPKCENCPLQLGCQAYRDNTWERYPVKKEKAKRRVVDKTVLILECQGEMALCKRAEEGLLAGLWELPNIDKKMNPAKVREWLQEQGIQTTDIQKAKKVKHIFTHIEWHMQCYLIRCQSKYTGYQWATKDMMEQKIALPTAFRKCLQEQ